MAWNWQHKNWPNFTYDTLALASYERQFLQQIGFMQGSIQHLSSDDEERLRITLIRDEAYKTTEIEGEILNRDSLQSSIRKHFGLKTDNRKASPAEYGIAEMLVDLYKNYEEPLTHKKLTLWHKMLTNGRRDLSDIGCYRTHKEPMQIISGSYHDPKIHFVAPPSDQVPHEMSEFIEWFNQNNRHHSDGGLPILVRAGIAHIYFESIHPFEDGNGRIGRAISEKILSQGLKGPTLIALAQSIERSKKRYYAALHEASKSLDIHDWLEYFCSAVLNALAYTQSMINFLIEKRKFYEIHATSLNERQHKVVRRMFDEGIDGFKGGLSADNYISISRTTRSTATRDLQKLVSMGAFTRTGEQRYTRYYLNIDHDSVELSD